MGYKIMEFIEIWHYHSGGGKIFKEFILNIVRRELECSGFPISCDSEELKQEYVNPLKEQCGIDIHTSDIKKDPAGRYLNNIMANSVWGKWAQNPTAQSGLSTRGTIREYHEKLLTGRVKRTSLISEKLMQVEMKCDRSIEGENRENANNRSGLGGRNTTVGAFVTTAARDLMYSRYLSKLQPDQLLYTDTDSVIVYVNKRNLHVKLPTSNILGELKDEHADIVREIVLVRTRIYGIWPKDVSTRIKRCSEWEGCLMGQNDEGYFNEK